MVGCVPRAVNEARTRDPQLGKLVLYQLSHIGLSLLIANGALSQMRCKGSCFFDKHQMFCRFYSLGMEKYHSKGHCMTMVSPWYIHTNP